MTVAKMHKQRTVNRANEKPRFTRQRKIKRGGNPAAGALPATGATAGIPGTWTPAGSRPPTTVAALQAGQPNVVTASPATGWTSGQFVQTQTSGAAGRATWTGTGWVGGVAPGLDDPQTFLAANHNIADIEAWVDEHPEFADEALSWEEGHQNRVTLIDWLEGFISDRDPGHVP